jgi:type II secretory pathway pseudopilin PulG
MRARLHAGFTLIEVLIAATIMFAAIAVVSDTYRASLAASRKAETTVRLLAPLRAVLTVIQQRLTQEPAAELAGKGEMMGVNYSFVAKSISHLPPARRFDPDVGELVNYQPRYRLYDVALRLTFAGQARDFAYREIAWTSSVAAAASR